MRIVSSYACAIVTAAMLAPGIGAYAQDSKLSVPNVEVTAPPFVGTRSPYFGRYRVEEDKFGEAPCSQTRIALGPSGKCLQGYRLGVPANTGYRGSSPCDMALDVVIDTTETYPSKQIYWCLIPMRCTRPVVQFPGTATFAAIWAMTRQISRT